MLCFFSNYLTICHIDVSFDQQQQFVTCFNVLAIVKVIRSLIRYLKIIMIDKIKLVKIYLYFRVYQNMMNCCVYIKEYKVGKHDKKSY